MTRTPSLPQPSPNASLSLKTTSRRERLATESSSSSISHGFREMFYSLQISSIKAESWPITCFIKLSSDIPQRQHKNCANGMLSAFARSRVASKQTEQIQTKAPKRKFPSGASSQPNIPKRKFLSERYQTNVPKWTFPDGSSQAKLPERKFLSEASAQAKDLKRKFRSESSIQNF